MGLITWIKSLFSRTKPNVPTFSIFKKSWTLKDFAKLKGRLAIFEINPNTSNSYWLCRFTSAEGKETFAKISSCITEVSPKAIKQNCKNLYIGLLNNGHYVLYNKDFEEWVEVDLK